MPELLTESTADSLLSSLWFQLAIALLVLQSRIESLVKVSLVQVLLLTLTPQLLSHWKSTERTVSDEPAVIDAVTNPVNTSNKNRKGKSKKGKQQQQQQQQSHGASTTESAQMEKQMKQIQEQQEELRRVQLETQRLKEAAEEEARQTRDNARAEAEQLTRRVMEQLNVKQQMEDLSAVRRAAEAEAAAVRQAAEAEAARLRKNAEDEASSLKKKAEEEALMMRAVANKKRDMEQEVAAAAAAARDKMADEVKILRERAEAEVRELKQRVTQEAAAMFQQAEKKSKQGSNSSNSREKPPKIPMGKLNPESSPRSITTPPVLVPSEPLDDGSILLPHPATPPKSPVVGSERESDIKRRSPHASPHASPNLGQPEGSQSSVSVVSPYSPSSSSCSTSNLPEQHWKRQQAQQLQSPPPMQQQPPMMQQVTPDWTRGWSQPSTHQSPQQPQQQHGVKPSGGVVPDMNQLVPYKMKLCIKFMQSGHCKRGAGCTYAHGEHEIGMPRPAQLQSVTLGEMNQRKKGKNMVTPDMNNASASSYNDDPSNQRYPFTSVNASRPQMNHHQMNPHQREFRPQQHEQPPGYGPQDSSLGSTQATDTQQPPPPRPQNLNVPVNIPMKSQWDKPPKLRTGNLASQGVPSPRPHHSKGNPYDALRASNESLRGSGGQKEPSPFLPLSPTLGDDEPWVKDRDGRAAMSWADSAATPVNTPPATGPSTPPWTSSPPKDTGSTGN